MHAHTHACTARHAEILHYCVYILCRPRKFTTLDIKRMCSCHHGNVPCITWIDSRHNPGGQKGTLKWRINWE